MEKIELKALGKINLGLDILGKRPNGYHDVRMVMQTVYLYDNVRLEKKREEGIELTTNLSFLPTDENNIAYKAARLLMDEFEIKGGVRITLDKHIPVSAGMAGGSSNAAAVLHGMNRLYRLGLTQEQLMERGVTLGADVPYCVMRGTVLAEGIGEILTPLLPLPKCYILIAKPPLSASTKVIYEKYDSKENVTHPDIDAILEGLREGNIRKIAENMGNVLEEVMIPDFPVLDKIKQTMKENGALGAMMSGSGPTVFGIFAERRAAKEAAFQIRKRGFAKQVYVTAAHNVRRGSYERA